MRRQKESRGCKGANIEHGGDYTRQRLHGRALCCVLCMYMTRSKEREKTSTKGHRTVATLCKENQTAKSRTASTLSAAVAPTLNKDTMNIERKSHILSTGAQVQVVLPPRHDRGSGPDFGLRNSRGGCGSVRRISRLGV